MPGIKTGLLMAWLVALLSGCSTLNKTVDANLDFTDTRYTPGQTHYSEVLDDLGPPCRLTALEDGFAFLYEELSIWEMQAGLSGRESWWQLLKLTLADTDLHRQVCLLRFDAEGILTAQGMTRSKEALGMAGAIQPILELQQIVDTAAYEDDAFTPMRWGTALLRPLPQTLNARQCIVSGEAGFEQSGTTTKIGQQALEMR